MNNIGIFAVDANWGFGLSNGLPWNYKRDMSIFKNITTLAPSGQINAVVMGYKTYKSIGGYLPNRYNIIVDRNANSTDYSPSDERIFIENIHTINNIRMWNSRLSDTVYYIGGVGLLESVWDSLSGLIITHIHTEHKCDLYLPVKLRDSISRDFKITSTQDYVENRVHLELIERSRIIT